MAIQRTGTEFVIKGLSSFLSGLKAANRGYQEVAKSATEMAKSFGEGGEKAAEGMSAATKNAVALGTALTVTVGAMLLAAKAIKGFISSIVNLGKNVLSTALAPLKKLADFVKTSLADAFRSTLKRAIDVAVESLGKLWDAAVKITSQFQTLEIRLQNLISRELRLSGAVNDVGDSFQAAVKPAEELTHWITQLSLKTPFSVTDIANTTAFAMAMGFTSDEAKSLTLSIGNFAAGMGLSSDKMESMIFNFGQMKAAGKVTGTEMRDLARGAFFPLVDVLDEAAGIMGVVADDMIEFRKAAAEGQVPIEVFFKAFQNVVSRDFPDAMERMKGTLQGVMTRFKNFAKTILGIELLGPLAQRFAEVAGNALDTILSPGVQRAARLIGEALPVAFDRLVAAGKTVWDAIKNLAAAFGIIDVSAMDVGRAIAHVVGFIQKLAQTIAGVINNIAARVNQQMENVSGGMRQWGFNIIAQLAQGMADALTAVVNVLIQLGQIITSFLKPGSPPKLLPHLDKWGAEAMTVYMKGWASADFSVFNEIADKVERFIRSMTENLLDKTDVVPTILEFRDRLAEALEKVRNGAKMTSGMLKRVFESFKNASPELIKYAKLLLKVAEADAAVAKAQEHLAAVTEKYDKILEPMQKRLEELNNATQDLDDTRRITQLRLILADVNASEGDKERARLEIERLLLQKQIRTVEEEKKTAVSAAEEKLKAAQEAREALQEQLDAAEALVDMQIKTNELIKEQLALLESLKEKLGKGTGGLEIPPFDPSGLISGVEDMGRQVSGLLDNARVDWENIFDDIASSISEDIDTIVGKFSEFETALGTLSTVWGGLGDLFKENRFSIALDTIKRSAEPVVESLTELVSTMSELLGIDMPTISFSLSDIAGALLEFALVFVVNNINAALAVFNGLIQGLLQPIKRFGEQITILKDAWAELWDAANLDEFLADLLNLMVQFGLLTNLTILVGEAITGFWSGVEESTVAAKGNIGTTLEGLKTDTVQKFQDTSDSVVGSEGSIVPKMMADIQTEVENKTGTIGGTIETFKDDTIATFEKMSEKLIGKSVVPDMLDAINDEFEKKLGVDGLLQILDDELQNAYDTFDDFLWRIFDEIIDPFVGTAIQTLSTIAQKLAAIISQAAAANEALNSMGKGDLVKKETAGGQTAAPTVTAQPIVVSGSGGNTTTTNNILNMSTSDSGAGAQRAFGIMELMNT